MSQHYTRNVAQHITTNISCSILTNHSKVSRLSTFQVFGWRCVPCHRSNDRVRRQKCASTLCPSYIYTYMRTIHMMCAHSLVPFGWASFYPQKHTWTFSHYIYIAIPKTIALLEKPSSEWASRQPSHITTYAQRHGTAAVCVKLHDRKSHIVNGRYLNTDVKYVFKIQYQLCQIIRSGL